MQRGVRQAGEALQNYKCKIAQVKLELKIAQSQS